MTCIIRSIKEHLELNHKANQNMAEARTFSKNQPQHKYTMADGHHSR